MSNELVEEVVLHKIGVCPICHQGQMLKGSAGWTCDYFKNINDKCSFTIFSQYHNVTLTENQAIEIIQRGETDPIEFLSRDEKKFTAKLKIVDKKVKTVFDDQILDEKCPICGGDVKELKNGYACENFFNNEQHCEFWINKIMCEREISRLEVEDLLKNKITPVMDNFVGKGKTFSTRLEILPSGKINFNSEICKCPKCNGTIHVGVKAYNCSNYRNPDIKCDFVIWRIIANRAISPEEVKELCEEKMTHLLEGFISKEKKAFAAQLTLNDNFETKFV